MIKILEYYFEKWWRPALIFGVSVLIYALCVWLNVSPIDQYAFGLCLLSFFGLILSGLYRLAIKEWWYGIITMILVGLSVFGFFIYSFAVFFTIQYSPDHYADHLVIPQNIRIHEPLHQAPASVPADPDFFIYNHIQPGQYRYTFWTEEIEEGKVFLKAFEVTNDDPLSPVRVKDRTTLPVFNPSGSLVRFPSDQHTQNNEAHFTIYEGDWGKPYAARFELWFVPERSGIGRKLAEKIYKIEGWQP